MRPAELGTGSSRVGYVVKMYPRLSETFIVNEILAHERAGLDLDIFSLRLPHDGRFHANLARVRASATYLPHARLRASELWSAVHEAATTLPGLWSTIQRAGPTTADEINQAIVLAHHVRKRGISHLHAHFATAPATVARLAAGMAGVPFSITAHAKDIYHESVEHRDLRVKLRDAAAVVTVSEFNRAHLRSEFGDDANRVHCIYNGLDLDRFAFAPPSDDSNLVLAVGRLVEKKGFADFIDACGVLRDRGVAFRAEIVGDGALRDELAARIADRGLTDIVHLVGALPQDAVVERMRSAALVAAPCVVAADGNRDGLPTVLLEAMALGAPCIATDVTGIPELVADGTTGLMTPQHDPAALADRIERLLVDRGLARALATGARQRIEERFDIHRNVARIRDLFATGGPAVVAAAREAG